MRTIVANNKTPWLGGNIQGGDEMTYFPQLWDFLIQRYSPKVICDVGCGEGHLMNYFHKKGVKVFGTDGLKENKDNAPKTIKEYITVHDYTTGPALPVDADMVISCEFVEHVEAKYLDNYLIQLIDCKTLVLTHALPGQGGYHHVNCRESKYWIDTIQIFGLKLSPATELARKLAVKHDKILWQTVLIFDRHGK